MGNLVCIHPSDAPVIDIGDLKQAVRAGVPGASFAEDDLAHPPIAVVGLGGVSLVIHDDEITGRHREKKGRWSSGRGTQGGRSLFGGHRTFVPIG